MPLVTKTYQASPDDPAELRRIDRAVQSLTGISRRQVTGLLDRGCVKLNGQPCGVPTIRLAVGDRVEVRYDPGQRYRPRKAVPEDRDFGFQVVFEDAHLVVVEKPAGLLTVPTHFRESGTLIERVSNYLGRGRHNERAFVVHRLDRDVSGLLVFGKALPIAEQLRDQFEQRKPEREYAALIAGVPDKFEGTFRNYLTTDKSLSRRSTRTAGEGELAITHYRVVRVLDRTSLVTIWLETGRRNQIRVHFAEAGHPVLGDPRYRQEEARHPRWTCKRLALHARLLGFTHPVTQEDQRFESVLPAEMEKFLRGGEKRPRRKHS